jgi:microcystin-dependent protein
MSFQTESPLRDNLVAAGGTDFAFTFPIYSKHDLIVLDEGVQRMLDVDYTVRSGSLPFESLPLDDVPDTGFVRFTIAPINGHNISIIPKQSLVQTSEYTTEPFPPARIERDLDKAVMLVRAVRETLRRCISFSLKSLKEFVEIDDPVPDAFLRYNAAGTRIIGVTGVAQLGPIVVPVSPADGGTGRVLVISKGDLLVGLADGLLQRLPVGTNNQLLAADSAQAAGMKWATPVEIETIPIGTISAYGGLVAPTGWVLCDGAAISRTTFAALFNIVGTVYGVGDGSTTFNTPNLKGRVPVGLDATQIEFDTLGEVGGAKTHTLTTAEMPAHSHTIDTRSLAASGVNVTHSIVGPTNTAPTSSVGGGAAHNNLQPYQVINYIIKH